MNIHPISILLTLPLLSSMKLTRFKRNPEYNGMTVMRSAMGDIAFNQSTFGAPHAVKISNGIHTSSKSFKIRIREIVHNGSIPGSNITDGGPFLVKLKNIEFDTMERSILLECFDLLQEHIDTISLREIMDEAESRDMSLIRRLATSLSPFLLKWWQFDLNDVHLETQANSIRKQIAIFRLLADIPGIDRICSWDPQWIFSRDIITLNMIERAQASEVAIDVIKATLHSMTVQEMDEKRGYIREMGEIAYEKAGGIREGDQALQQIMDSMPALPDPGERVGKRWIVRHCFEGISTPRPKTSRLIKRT